MKKINLLISTFVIALLIVGGSVSCYAECIGMVYINADGSTSSAPQEVVDQYNYLIKTQGTGAASLFAANAVGTPAGPGYAMPGGHDIAYYNAQAAGKTSGSSPAVIDANAQALAQQQAQLHALEQQKKAQEQAIAQEQARIQAEREAQVLAQQEAQKAAQLAYLQANGFTIDPATGQIIPLK